MNADLFAAFGLYVRRQFLEPDVCSRLAAEVRTSPSRPATVREAAVQAVDERYRRSCLADVSDQTVALLHERVLGLTADLARHFRVPITRCRRPEFLVYRPGDFFLPHADSIRAGGAADQIVTSRLLTIVMFLNDASATPGEGGYQGGSLDFYGLIEDARMKNRPLSLAGEAGLLVAFRAETMHGVAPIVAGERYTAVTWFEGPSGPDAPSPATYDKQEVSR